MRTKKPSIPCVLREAESRRQEQSAGTDLYIQKINKHHLWDVEERYRVPNAISRKYYCKYWRKVVEQMSNMW